MISASQTKQFLRIHGRKGLYLMVFAAVGAAVILSTNALGSSYISGTAFKDFNRNGIQDQGEPAMSGHSIYLLDGSSGSQIANTATDSSGRYTFNGLSAGTYEISFDSQSWWTLRSDWVPTTTGSVFPRKTVHLVDSVTVDFGWRQIIRSTNQASPISSYTGPNGLKVNSYNDAVTAKDIYDRTMLGTLVGQEAAYTTISLDLGTATLCSVSVSGSPGGYSNYQAVLQLSWTSWLEGDRFLSHEYGHAWSLYYAHMVQQNTDLNGYLQLRSIASDPRLDTSHAWNRRELIAEDYRQLFGTPDAQSVPQENRDLPAAKDVPGLREYLSGAFMTSGRDNVAPSAPGNLRGETNSMSQIDLTWTASTDNVGVTRYEIYRNDLLVGFTNNPSTNFTDTTLNPGTSYQYYVKALDAAGNQSAPSSSITATTKSQDSQPPSAPTILTSPTQTNNSISLSWKASTDNVGIAEYRIYRLGNSRKTTYANFVGTATSTNFTAGNLSRNTSYSFYVVAVDAAGNQSSPSNTLTIKTKR